MPKYRSITFSIMSQWEMKQFPEFPHPESIQYVYRGPGLGTDGSKLRRSRESATTAEVFDKLNKASGKVPSVACYIPSVQGVRFFFKYTIEPPYPDGQLFYFKLFMNGRHICSWGVNPRTNPRGQVLRALFEAEEKYDVMEDSGNVLRHGRIESRPFLFAQDTECTCAASDGGLIEIRVFRAKGRRRKLPNVEKFKPQNQYGINLPSAGLVDKPQDTKFYDWILADPIDEPYGVFHFHYRSWEYLQSLQLIPALYPRTLLKPSNSFALLAGSTETEDTQSCKDNDVWDTTSEYDLSGRFQESVAKLPNSLAPCNLGAFDGRDSLSETGNQQLEFMASNSRLKGLKHNQASLTLSDYSVSRAMPDEWFHERPLPKLPKAKSSFEHSRRSSTSSNAPSLTPSLSSWFERDLNNPSPEPVIEVAAAMPILRTTSQIKASGLSSSISNLCADSHDGEQAFPSHQFTLKPSSEVDVLPRGTITRKSIQNSPDSTTRLCLLPIDGDNEDGFLQTFQSRVLISPSESQWLNRQQALSPVKRYSKHNEKALPHLPVFEEGTGIGNPIIYGMVNHNLDNENRNRSYDFKKDNTAEHDHKERDAGAGPLRGSTMYSSPGWI